MAFQKTLADIPTPVVTEVAPVDTSGASRISALGAIAGQTVKDVQKNRLEADIQQSADVVTAIEGAVAEKGPGVFDTTGGVNTDGLSPDLQQQIKRVQANAGDKFKRIRDAVNQGAMPANAAALETEATVRELISQTPGFGQEIKQLARELVGFDPSGFALRKVLDVDRPTSKRVTAQQKRIEEAKTMQHGLALAGQNVALDDLLGSLAVRDQKSLQKETADSQLALNNINIEQWAQQSYVERGVDLANVMLKVVSMGQDGGITDTRQYANAAIAQRENDKREFRQEVANRGGMETSRMQAIETQIDAQYKPIIDSINENKLGDVLQDRLDLVVKLNSLWGKQATPRLTRMIDAYGPQIGGQLLEMMANIADPKQFELVYQFDPALKELIQSGQQTQRGVADGIETVINKVLKGGELTRQDLLFRNMTEIMITQPGNTAIREEYVKGLGNIGAPVRAVSILSTKVPRVRATNDEVKFMKDQYNIYVGTPATEGIPGNLIDGMAREIMELDVQGLEGGVRAQPVIGRTERQAMMAIPVSATGQTKITIPFDPTGQGTTLDFQTNSMKRMQPFMDAVMLKGYAPDVGVSKEAFADDVLTRVNARLVKLRAERAEAIKLAKEQKEGADDIEVIQQEELVE